MAKPVEPAQRPKRLTLSEIVEALLQRSGGDRTGITLARNAKGETQIEVVVRTADDGEVQTPEQAMEKAAELYNTLRSRYPMASGFTGAVPE